MDGKPLRITLRVTSRGNAIMHEMKEAETPDDPTKYDNPITVFYLDSDRLILMHYCDAGNRPRMAAKTSPDGKTVEFDVLDVSGSTEYGHMDHAVFTVIDANHHTEDWTYMMPGEKPCERTSTCSGRNDDRYLSVRTNWKTGWTVSGMTVSRFTASFATASSR